MKVEGQGSLGSTMIKLLGLIINLSASSAFTSSSRANIKWAISTSANTQWQFTNVGRRKMVRMNNAHAGDVSVLRVRPLFSSDASSPVSAVASALMMHSLQVATAVESESCELDMWKDIDNFQTTSSQENQVFQLINEERTKRGMIPFFRDKCLDFVAHHGAELLVTDTSDRHGGAMLGDTLKQRIQNSGYENINPPEHWKTWDFRYGELYQIGSPSMRGLLKNPKHFQTLLGPDFDEIGIKMIRGQGHDHSGVVLLITLASIHLTDHDHETMGTHQETVLSDCKLETAPNLSSSSSNQQQQGTVTHNCPKSQTNMTQQENILSNEVFDLTNKERAASGLPALTRNRLLDMAAFRHAVDMHQRQYFAHVTPEGVTYDQRIERTGYLRFDTFGREGWKCRTATGENLAAGQLSPAEAVNDWMESPTHRDNIVSTEFLELGVGVYDDHWVQSFGTVDLQFSILGRIRF
jgi:uncharacterized protein YkwD